MDTDSQLRDEALRLRVRERIEDGRLPLMLATEIIAGYGTGEVCLVCDQPITPVQIEYEVDHEVSCSRCRLRMHLGCHVIWQIECDERIAQRRRREKED